MKYATVLARVLFSLIFIMSGLSHFSAGTVQYAESQGVPLAAWVVPFSGLMALVGGLSILAGFQARIGAVLIALFIVPVSISMHAFWNVTDPMMKQLQMIMFMKNMSILGGALLIMANGAGAWSIDAWRNTSAKVARPSALAV
ncbi:putative oxidoreductase [Filimonas zeae]|nr:DoxX family protein [Filimonas zeae]MDR6339250.1 putative oxidoreductase [Filimonas zeae]